MSDVDALRVHGRDALTSLGAASVEARRRGNTALADRLAMVHMAIARELARHLDPEEVRDAP